jgi:hypothetical protein
LRASPTYAEMIADTTFVAVREVTPLVGLAGYASKATTNRNLNGLTFYRNFHSGSVSNSEQNDSSYDNGDTHMSLHLVISVQL